MRRKKQEQPHTEEPGTGQRSEPDSGPSRSERRLTAIDIQQKEFRGARWGRGYNEAEVDEFLDEVTEEMTRLHAENKRLREESAYRGTARLSTDPALEGEAVIRRAREEANRIINDAQSRAGQLRAEPEDRADRTGSPLAGLTGTAEWRAGRGRLLSRAQESLQ